MNELKRLLGYYITGAIERGETVAITEIVTHLDCIENGTIRQINAYFRANDESHKWPICDAFNVTERAIRRLRKIRACTGKVEYFKALDAEISKIVNNLP